MELGIYLRAKKRAVKIGSTDNYATQRLLDADTSLRLIFCG